MAPDQNITPLFAPPPNVSRDDFETQRLINAATTAMVLGHITGREFHLRVQEIVNGQGGDAARLIEGEF
jgi:hypothetical protein